MARPKKGIIYSLEGMLEQLLETIGAFNERLDKMEAVIGKAITAAKIGPKPAKKRGRKPGPKKTCKIDGCKREHYAKGLCASHYQQRRLKEKGKQSKTK